MSIDLTKEEEKESSEDWIIKQRCYENYEYLNKELKNIDKNLKGTKGLSIAIDNITIECYAKPLEEHGKAFKMKHIGRLFALMILYRLNELNKHVSFEFVASLFNLNTNVSYNRLKSDVRKALKELYPSIEYKEDPLKGIKFTHIPKGANKGNHIEKNETRGFTQLYCELLRFDNNVIVLFTVLEYFYGSSKEAYPSIDTLCKLTGCRTRDTINKLLQEYQVTEEKKGLWKKISSKGGSKQNTNRYELSYITKEGVERYYYLDFIEEQLNQEKEELLEEKSKLEKLIGVENIESLSEKKKKLRSIRDILNNQNKQKELLEEVW